MRRRLGVQHQFDVDGGRIGHDDDVVHHANDGSDDDQGQEAQEAGGPQNGDSRGDHDDALRAAAGDHHVRADADGLGPGSGGRSSQDDHQQPPADDHHRSAGIHEHEPGLLRPRSLFILVAGPPGSGKSSLAAPLARELGLPLLAKDEIKEALMAVLGPPATVEESRRLGRAAVMAMLAVARASPGAVLDSTFYPYTVPHLEQLPGTVVEIRCRCPREVAQARYEARSAGRHAGHLDSERPPEELWNEHHLVPLGLGPLLEVDTSRPVDVASVADGIRPLAGRTV